MVGSGLGQGWVRVESELGQGWIMVGSWLGQGWVRVGSGLGQGWVRVESGLSQSWVRVGSGLSRLHGTLGKYQRVHPQHTAIHRAENKEGSRGELLSLSQQSGKYDVHT
jgi:hypothetical protein